MMRIIRKVFGLSKNDTEAIYRYRYEKLLDYYEAYRKVDRLNYVKSTVSCVIFSKDRPLQLYSLLKSMLQHVNNLCKVIILYDVSSEDFNRAYNEMRMDSLSDLFHFIKQTDFKQDLINILENLNTEKLFFLVDDIVFTESCDLQKIIAIDSNRYILSLRLGENIEYSYTVGRDQKKPDFFKSEDVCDLLYWEWRNGDIDWGYPLSVDGNIFFTKEILCMTSTLDFLAPNSYETELQIFNDILFRRCGVCYKKSKIVNIPINKVQNENTNKAGIIQTNYLLDKWREGYMLDIGKLYGLNNYSAHQEIEIEYVKR